MARTWRHGNMVIILTLYCTPGDPAHGLTQTLNTLHGRGTDWGLVEDMRAASTEQEDTRVTSSS